jgi:uncharacterized protein (DUF2344 family)
MKNINEKSVSTSQQRLMAQAYAIKVGAMKPSDLNPKYKKAIMNLADSMTKKELEKYASTKHKNLPHHVDEDVNEGITGEIAVSLEPIGSDKIPSFHPKGPGKVVPFLDPESKQTKKGKKNLENLKDYRDWINDNKK